MADDSDLEKTEAATGRRIQRAREDGKVVQSKELAIFIQLMAGVAGPLLMGGWNFTWKPLTPDLTKFNHIAGMKRMVSLNGLMELMKASVKAALVGSIGPWVVWRYKA